MKKYLSQLRPLERRLVVGVAVVLIVVLNAVYVWPHFSDWDNLKGRMATARRDLARDQNVIADAAKYEPQVKALEKEGAFVALEDQAINFMRTVQQQASQTGVGILNTSRQMSRTNDAFFIEQVQNITVVATDAQLVDFLYKLGSGPSMIRVRDLELQPDASHLHLNANIQLIASYQKKPLAASSSLAKAK
jgi:type II secretory pathway component PulM